MKRIMILVLALASLQLGGQDLLHFKKVVSVYTPLDLLTIADEKVMLGDDFMDKYEDPAVHRKAEVVQEAFKK